MSRQPAVPPGPALETERLLLRRWRSSDEEPFAALNGDEEVMEHFPNVLTRAESDWMIADLEARFERQGYGLWAVEVRESGEMVGFVGLNVPTFAAPFMPAVEVGWRLRKSAWGHGYATEAARASLSYGFSQAGLDEIVAMTTTTNSRSAAVMERLGMRRDPADDFEHPGIERGHPLRRHILYRLSADEWARR
jgi:ribosomal-protein-alanine N-acetyltransferase